VYLSYYQPTDYILIGSAIAFEQFGYGFSLTSFFLYMIYFADGQHKTAHYAICTGFMAAGLWLPGMLAGKLQEVLGYYHFFLFIMFCAIPTLAVIPFLKIDKAFGKKNNEVES
jgi:PAT family beta-lactamase induction signal transducer AmpG